MNLNFRRRINHIALCRVVVDPKIVAHSRSMANVLLHFIPFFFSFHSVSFLAACVPFRFGLLV